MKSVLILFAALLLQLYAVSATNGGHGLIPTHKNRIHKASELQHPPAVDTVKSLHHKLTSKHVSTDFATNVQSLIDRVLNRAGVKFSFRPVLELIDYEEVEGQPMDVFEIDHKDNQIVLRGSSGIALSTAFGHYLRYYTNCDFHWERGGSYSFEAFPATVEQLPLPATKERVVFLSKWRYYQNTCTTSYSFVWRNWQSMEMEIDWMAMNGFNLPLAFTGQEIVWQKLWRHYGISEESLQAYFSGPAFLTWQRMANIRGFGGPLSDSWINQQADLQRQILARYADLGMTPVLPAFNGVVPPEMQQLFPTANITRLYPSWNDFPDQYCCNYILSSVDPLFQEIGKLYLEYQVQIFGEVAKSHVYNCDTFNENKPASSDFDYLAGSSSAVYNSMISADPDAVWLMQGWLFVNDPFWVDDNIASYLAGVPDNGMIILDLAAEDLPVWNKIAANKKQFIWCMLHNYGGSRALYGNLTLLATDPISVQQTVPEYFLGTGLTMESIDQNPVVYEFMTEMAFHRSSPDVSDWVQKYAGRRYGLLSSSVSDDQRKSVNDAWTLLFANNYNGETPVCHHPCVRRSVMTVRPAWTLSQSTAMQAGPLADVWSTMIGVGLQSNAFTYDLVDVGRQVISNLFYDVYALAHAAYTRKDSVRFQQISERMIKMFSDWDELLSSHKSYLLGTWIADARSWAKDATEADLFDYNARNQITLWGDVGEIDDYAAKNWGGLVDGYYKKRWELFLKSTLTAIYKNQTLDVNSFNYEELQIGQFFCTDYNNTFPTEPTGSPIDISKNLQKKYGNAYEAEHGYVMLESTTLNGYDLTTVPMWTKNIAQLQFLCDIESSCEGFTTDGYLKTTSTGTTSKTGVNFYMKSKCTQAKC